VERECCFDACEALLPIVTYIAQAACCSLHSHFLEILYSFLSCLYFPPDEEELSWIAHTMALLVRDLSVT
jgi:hypothetical protein